MVGCLLVGVLVGVWCAGGAARLGAWLPGWWLLAGGGWCAGVGAQWLGVRRAVGVVLGPGFGPVGRLVVRRVRCWGWTLAHGSSAAVLAGDKQWFAVVHS